MEVTNLQKVETGATQNWKSGTLKKNDEEHLAANSI